MVSDGASPASVAREFGVLPQTVTSIVAYRTYKPVRILNRVDTDVLDDAATEHRRYWFAGLLEGEGSFMLMNLNSGYPCLRIKVGSRDRDVIAAAARFWGRKVRSDGTNAAGNPMFATDVSGTAAVPWMASLHPLMGQ